MAGVAGASPSSSGKKLSGFEGTFVVAGGRRAGWLSSLQTVPVRLADGQITPVQRLVLDVTFAELHRQLCFAKFITQIERVFGTQVLALRLQQPVKQGERISVLPQLPVAASGKSPVAGKTVLTAVVTSRPPARRIQFYWQFGKFHRDQRRSRRRWDRGRTAGFRPDQSWTRSCCLPDRTTPGSGRCCHQAARGLAQGVNTARPDHGPETAHRRCQIMVLVARRDQREGVPSQGCSSAKIAIQHENGS